MAAENLEFIKYDIIIVLNYHGGYDISSEKPMECFISPIPSNMSVTFLEAVPCGTSNLSYDDWSEKIITKMSELIDIYSSNQSFLLKEFIKNDYK